MSVFQTGLEALLEKVAALNPRQIAKLQGIQQYAATAKPGQVNPHEMARVNERLQGTQNVPAAPPQTAPTSAPQQALAAIPKALPAVGQSTVGTQAAINAANPAKKPGLLKRMALPAAAIGLGIGAAGTYGALSQHDEDKRRDSLIYAPLRGVS